MNTPVSARCKIATRVVSTLICLGVVFTARAESTDPGGGIGGTGISGYGVVQKFGSIFVNGREFFLDNSTRVTRDGAASDEKALRIGDVVRVEGHVDPSSGKSRALRVDRRVALRGRIEAVNAAAGTVTVLDQTVHVTSATVGHANERGALLLGKLRPHTPIAVSGFVRSDGSWVATRISALAADDSRFVLHGVAQTIDAEHGRFSLGGQILALPPTLRAPLRLGDTVRVAGHYVGAALRVESVERDRPIKSTVGQTVEMGGYLQTRTSTGNLVSNGIVLKYSSASAFIGGTAADLHKDVPIAVRGELQSDGSVAVREILVNVEPMRAALPEFDGAAQRPERGGHAASETREHDKPELGKSEAAERELDRPDKPGLEYPHVEKPEIEHPFIERPEVERPGTE